MHPFARVHLSTFVFHVSLIYSIRHAVVHAADASNERYKIEQTDTFANVTR